MNDYIAPVYQETYRVLSALIIALGAGIGVKGVLNVLDGCGNNVPGIQELGERQLKMAGNLVFLAVYVKEGILPEPEIMEYLAAR